MRGGAVRYCAIGYGTVRCGVVRCGVSLFVVLDLAGKIL